MMNNKRPTGSRFALRVMLLASAAVLGTRADVADANPLSPTASDPGVSYTGLGTNNTNIDLDKQRTIIDWGSFNIGSGETTRFFFGSNNWIVLNRVNQGSASINGNLFGCLDASCSSFGGNIWVYAADGVLIGPNARVNAGGFLATTSPLATSDANFLAGTEPVADQFDFGASIGTSSIDVASGAQINAANGSVALVAPEVTTHAGSSVSASGTVLYGAAQSYRIKFAQDSSDDLDLVDFEVPAGRAGGTSSSTPISVGGNTTASRAFIASVSKADVADAIIDVSGSVTAKSASMQGGDIVLSGDGDVNVSGTLSGSNVSVSSTGGTTTVSGSVIAQQANGAGGNITVTAPNVVLRGDLDASGTIGGTILVGGDIHGGANPSQDLSPTPVATANTTNVASGAVIDANGTAGAGGSVVVWSNSSTNFAGSISATGNGGNGGFVETSGAKLVLGQTAFVDTLSVGGKIGNWLLDPATNWNIANSGGDETPAQVVTALHSSSVTIAADNNITVTDPINATTDASATGNLVFEAGNSIFINGSITLNGGSFTATANDWSDLGTGLADRAAGSGVFQMASGTTIDTGVGSQAVNITVDAAAANTASPTPGGAFTPGAITLYGIKTGSGAVTISGAAGISLAGAVAAGAGTVDLISGSTIDENSGTGTITTTGTLTGSSSGTVTLTGANAIADLGAFSTSNNNFSLDNGALSITGALNAGTGTVNLVSTSTLGESGSGTITAGTLTGSSVGGATLNGANKVGALGNFTNTSSGDVALTDAQALTVSGILDNSSVSANVSLTTTGANSDLTVSGTIKTNTSWVLSLVSSGKIDESAGAMTAGALTGSSVGGATFTGTNHIASLYGFTNSGSGGFDFTDAGSLVVAPYGTGTIDAGSGNLTLTTTGAGHGIGLQDNLVAGSATGTQTITLDSAGSISQTAGTITGGILTGYSTGGTSLTSALNAIGALSGFTVNTSGGFFLTDSAALDVTGNISAPGNVYLESSNAGGITFTTGVSAALDITSTGSGLVSVQSDKVTFSNAGSFKTVFTGGTLEYAPNTAGNTVNLTVAKTTDFTAAVTTFRIGAVTLPGALAPTTTAGAINVAENLNFGSLALELDAAKVGGGTGNIVFGGTFNAGSLLANAAGAIDLNSTAVTTTGTQEYNGAVALGASNDLSGSTVTFDSTVDGAQALTVTGNAVLKGVVGGAPLTSLHVTGATTIDTTAISTSGAQTYDGAVTLGANADLTGSTVTFGGTLDDAAANTHDLTVTGDTVFDGVVGATPLHSLHVTGTTAINTTGITTSTTQAYDGAVMLGASANLTGSTVTLGSTLNDVPANTHDLTISGAAQFDGIVGGATALNSLHVTGATTIATTEITTNTTQTYDSKVTLGSTTTLVGSTVTFKAAVDPAIAYGLTVDGNAVFDGAVSGLSTLLVNGGTDINGGAITTTGSQEYNGAVTLTADANLTGTTITFDSTVDAKTAGAQNLTITGNAVFDGIVGTTALSSLHVTGGTTIDTTAISTAGTQAYDGAVTLGASADLTGSTVTFGGTLDDAAANTHDLTVTGNAVFDGIVGGTPLNSLHVTGATTIDTTAISTFGAQTYDGAVTLGANADLTGSTVTFGSTLDDATANTHDLTVTGDAVFDGIVGSTALKSLHVTGGSTIDTTAITTSGAQTYDGAVTLGANANLTGTTVTFGSTLDDAAANTHDLTVTGDAVFDGVVGGTPLNSLDVTGTTNINTTGITTSGTQTYGGKVTLGSDTTLSGSTVTFDAAVDPAIAHALTVDGDAVFDGPVSGLSTLLVNGTTDINGGSIGTSGTQEYNGDVTLSANANLTGSAITFDKKVDGAHALTVTANTGAATFSGAVGSSNPLTSLKAVAGTTISGGAVTVSSSLDLEAGTTITFSGPISTPLLTGSSHGDVNFTGANTIAELGNFTTNNGAFTLHNGALSITGALDAGTGTVDLELTGLLNEGSPSVTGTIIAATLTGASVGGADLSGNNAIAALGNFTNTTSGSFQLTNTKALTVSGILDNQVGDTTLTTTGAGSNLVISGTINANGHTLDTVSAGTIDESAGTITAATLAGSSVGGATFTGTNLIGALGNFTNATSGNFDLTDGRALTVSGTLDNQVGNTTLTTAGAGSNLVISGTIKANGHTLDTVSAGTIDESAGAITAATLTGSSVGDAAFTGTNSIDTLAGFDAGAGFALTDDPALTISSDINSGTGPLTLTTTGGPADGIVLDANLIAGTADGTQTVTLNSAGAIAQIGGTITGGTLTGSSVGGATLNNDNAIATLAGFTNASSGDVSFVDTHALAVSQALVNPVGNVSLTTIGAGKNLTIDAVVNAGANTASFNAGGDFIQNSGTLQANTVNIVTTTGNILIGEKAFTDIVAVKDPNAIDQAGSPFFTTSPAFANHVFIDAQNVSFSAPQRIVMQNTGTAPTDPVFAPEGFSLNHTGALPVAILIGGKPQVVDIFGELVQNGLLVDPRSVATTTQVEFAPDGTVANVHYRVNGCVVHQNGVCTIVSFDFKGFEPAKLAELVLASASGNEDVEEDLTITGAGNDEIWEGGH